MLAAIQLFDPGLMMAQHRQQLVDELRHNKVWTDTTHPYEHMRKEAAQALCTCAIDPWEEGKEWIHTETTKCNLGRMRDDLLAFAWKIWIAAHVDYKSQKILRDIAPNAYWDVFVESFPDGDIYRKGRFVYPDLVLTRTLIHATARRLIGRSITIQSDRSLGVAAGDVVINLQGNGGISITQDTGHCVQIWCGFNVYRR